MRVLKITPPRLAVRHANPDPNLRTVHNILGHELMGFTRMTAQVLDHRQPAPESAAGSAFQQRNQNRVRDAVGDREASRSDRRHTSTVPNRPQSRVEPKGPRWGHWVLFHAPITPATERNMMRTIKTARRDRNERLTASLPVHP